MGYYTKGPGNKPRSPFPPQLRGLVSAVMSLRIANIHIKNEKTRFAGRCGAVRRKKETEAPGLQEYGASGSLECHPPDKMVDEIRCHSKLDESEEKIQAQTPLLFFRFHGILSFCCSLQGQRYGSVLPGFDIMLYLQLSTLISTFVLTQTVVKSAGNETVHANGVVGF